MKSALSLIGLAVLWVGCFVGSASACPVATSAVAIPTVVAPVVFDQAPVVVQTVPAITTLTAPAIAVLATPTVVEEVVKVKARRCPPRRRRLFAR